MVRAFFIDPERITSRLFGGPYFIAGWESEDGECLFSECRTKMWFRSVVDECWRESRNYIGHKC